MHNLTFKLRLSLYNNILRTHKEQRDAPKIINHTISI
jgi:hypothetical protein